MKTRRPLIRAWTKKTMGIYEEAKAQYAQGRWSGWPENSNQDLVFEWLINFQDTVLTELRHRYYISAHNVLGGLEANRMPNIFLTSASDLANNEHDWSNILIIGDPNRILIRIAL
jgi:hypothetical protein